jgi:hypothetical protein
MRSPRGGDPRGGGTSGSNVGDGGRRPDVEEGSRGHVLLSHGLTKNSPPTKLHGMPTHQDYLLKQNPKGMWQKR